MLILASYILQDIDEGDIYQDGGREHQGCANDALIGVEPLAKHAEGSKNGDEADKTSDDVGLPNFSLVGIAVMDEHDGDFDAILGF